jgi:hypothetical protein
MPPFRVVAIPTEIAKAVRTTRMAPVYGHPAYAEIATGYGPCRLCLRDFAIGTDRRLLFTYDSFHGKEDLPLPGPVFIHESSCERYPEDGGFPANARRRPLTLNAYARGRRLVAQEYVRDGSVEPTLARLFESNDVDYVHVRDTSAGCFDFAVERCLTGRCRAGVTADRSYVREPMRPKTFPLTSCWRR